MTQAPRGIPAAYDAWAASYDDDRNATRDLDALVLRSAGLTVDGLDVVELGAGTGKNTEWLAERARTVTALDFSAGMLRRARSRIRSPGVAFVHCDLRETWPLHDGSADLVVGDLVLEHIADVTSIFAEIARVLRPGGEAYLAELHPERQARGGQAQFTDAATGERVFVEAFRHTVDEFRAAGMAARLRELSFEDHDDAGAPDGTPPRLLVMRFARTG